MRYFIRFLSLLGSYFLSLSLYSLLFGLLIGTVTESELVWSGILLTYPMVLLTGKALEWKKHKKALREKRQLEIAPSFFLVWSVIFPASWLLFQELEATVWEVAHISLRIGVPAIAMALILECFRKEHG